MPLKGYLTAEAIDAAVQHLASKHPSCCKLVTLPEASIEGRPIRALEIGGGRKGAPGVFFLAGVHARELVNPDLLVSFAARLCHAVTAGAGLTFGHKSYPAKVIRQLVEELSIHVLPLANPDGRLFTQTPGGDAMWRKNRRKNPHGAPLGVDLNRNYDFLWSSGIGTSDAPSDDTFHGAHAFSEPETRNVRHVVDTFETLRCFVDLHSYSQSILYSWGDDEDQTTDPRMCFHNARYDGHRGIAKDSKYREFIDPEDLARYKAIGAQVREGIVAVRGQRYHLKQAVGLYPTSGCGDDYTYSRHYTSAGKRGVLSFTVETAKDFQPPYAEALEVIAECSAGLVEVCLANLPGRG